MALTRPIATAFGCSSPSRLLPGWKISSCRGVLLRRKSIWRPCHTTPHLSTIGSIVIWSPMKPGSIRSTLITSTAGAANTAIKKLMREGGIKVVESPEARRHLAKFLQRWPSKRIVRARRTGWFEHRGRRMFVLPNEMLGAADEMPVILDGVTRFGSYGFHRAGTSEQWREYIAKPLAGNSNVILPV